MISIGLHHIFQDFDSCSLIKFKTAVCKVHHDILGTINDQSSLRTDGLVKYNTLCAPYLLSNVDNCKGIQIHVNLEHVSAGSVRVYFANIETLVCANIATSFKI